MGIIQFLVTSVILIVLFGTIGLILWATLHPTYERIKFGYLNSRSDNIRGITLPLGKIFDERDIEKLTEELDSRTKIRTGHRMHNVRAITSAVAPDGFCYITLWYKSHTPAHVDRAYNYYDMSQFKIF